MKGLTHFVTGVAATSFLPAAVEAGANGNPLYFILGGIFGLLPDTIDFKFRRFFSRYDMQVVPDPKNPDPQIIADAVAHAVNKAHMTGKPVRIKLHTIQLDADTWRQYTVRFDVAGKQVVVEYGPAVSTGQIPLPGTELEKCLEATAPLACPIVLDYQARNVIDIFDGPIFAMTPTADGKVCPEFIPWHRQWSHSLVTGVLLALAGAAIGVHIMETPFEAICIGLAILGGSFAHILGDQLGFMGSALLFPFVRKRTKGLGFMHSMEATPNFVTVWVCCLLIFWNLCRVAPSYVPRFTLLQLLVFGAILPFGVLTLGARILRFQSNRLG